MADGRECLSRMTWMEEGTKTKNHMSVALCVRVYLRTVLHDRHVLGISWLCRRRSGKLQPAAVVTTLRIHTPSASLEALP